MPLHGIRMKELMDSPSATLDRVEIFVEAIQKLNINFVAIDFDQTFVTAHTQGKSQCTGDELSACVRDIFRRLCPCLIRAGIRLAIVTFSGQVRLIKEVLDLTFPKFAEEIVVRGRDGTWEYKGGGSKAGKQAHMASAAEVLTSEEGTVFTRGSTLLIDDDPNNVKNALENGVRAVQLDLDSPEEFIERIIHLAGLT